ACSGIYFAIEEPEQVAYIGQSTNIRQRWQRHHLRNGLCDLNDLNSARRGPGAWLQVEKAERHSLEADLIRRFKPRLNTQLIPVDKPEPETEMKPGMKKAESTRMLSPKEYAEAIGKPYTTVMTWLQNDLIPQAVKTRMPGPNNRHFWEIPEGTKPPDLKPGPRPKTKTKK